MNILNSFSPIHHRSCRLITCLVHHTITMFNGPLDFGQWVTPFGQLSAIHQLDHALWAHPRNDGYALDRYRMKERNFFASINCCPKFISSFRAIETLFGTLWFDWRSSRWSDIEYCNMIGWSCWGRVMCVKNISMSVILRAVLSVPNDLESWAVPFWWRTRTSDKFCMLRMLGHGFVQRVEESFDPGLDGSEVWIGFDNFSSAEAFF